VTVSDPQGKRLWKKPMWLGLTGKRRSELTAEGIFDYYRSRYDIEYFFRFGKDKLLQRAFSTVLDHVGTPASPCVARGKPKGR